MNTKAWADFIFDESVSFDERCLEVYRFQKEKNQVFNRFSTVLGFYGTELPVTENIPLLPIRAFNQGIISVDDVDHELVFQSSGTTGMNQSSHYIHDSNLYVQAISRGFYAHFPKEKYALICYMPGYRKNTKSSLIWMAEYLISQDDTGLARFFDNDAKDIDKWEIMVKERGRIPLLFGAAFGLIDIIDSGKSPFSVPFEIIETGGMKTYRREITKKRLRKKLSDGFSVPLRSIHSEYGMCELLSQMYAIGDEWFTAPHWVQVTIRNPEYPEKTCSPGVEGKIGIIDLANVYSCPFILTDDRGVSDDSGRFKVLGRWNNDDPRGCNFLIDRD
jgi:hypothetical protein